DEIKKLADAMLKSPLLIEVARRNTVSETITHRVHPVAAERKRYLLKHLLEDPAMRQVLVFVGTKFGAARLASWLERQGISATAIHGDKSQQERTKALEAFKSGGVRVLVATDVAARGLDIDDLPHVINFDLPRVAEDYVHRIGRTGRAGKPGEATSLVAPEEMRQLAEIEKLTCFTIERVMVPGFEPGTTAPLAGHEERAHRGHGHEHEKRARHGPKAPIDHLPAPAAHLPSAPRQPAIAADGFDFSKPYTPKEAPAAPQKEEPSALAKRHPRKPLRPVAALLGGFAKKPENPL
ncbi:MAG: helicase-related protein, partial [Rhodocyclaceae bacterium]